MLSMTESRWENTEVNILKKEKLKLHKIFQASIKN